MLLHMVSILDGEVVLAELDGCSIRIERGKLGGLWSDSSDGKCSVTYNGVRLALTDCA